MGGWRGQYSPHHSKNTQGGTHPQPASKKVTSYPTHFDEEETEILPGLFASVAAASDLMFAGVGVGENIK